MTQEEIELEKLKIKRNREKFWIGTVLLGLFSLLLNNSIQKNKIEQERVRQENEHLSKFVEYAVKKDLETRRDMAMYFATISYSKETRTRWKNYSASIDTLVDLQYSLMSDIKTNRVNKDKLLMQISEAKYQLSNNKDNIELNNKIKELEDQLESYEKLIEEKVQKLKKIQRTDFVYPEQEKPLWYIIAENELNKIVVEISGNESNPEIIKYHNALTSTKINSDETPWSSSFINWCLKQADIKGTGTENNASWLNWGIPIENPQIGCIIIFWSEFKKSGITHVGFYAGDAGDNVFVLGGDQTNSVKVSSYPKNKILGYRWPN